MNWHVPGDTLSRYAVRPEAIDDVTASSIEQHLITCEACRTTVADAADVSSLEASWASVVDVIDQPRPWLAERVLTHVGLPSELARVVGATSGLRLAWLGLVVVLGGAAVAAARAAGSDTPFLVFAPIVPLVAVALGFLPVAEPAGEAAVATPVHGVDLVVRRTLAVLVPTIALLSIVGLAVPDLAGLGFAWVLPGLGLAAAALALSTFVRVPLAVGGLAGVWFLLLMIGERVDGVREPLGDTPIFGAAGQLVSLAVLAGAIVVLVARRDRFATMEVSW
jgi:hypothetical protein